MIENFLAGLGIGIGIGVGLIFTILIVLTIFMLFAGIKDGQKQG
jgi:hypothetical protein